MKTRRAAIVAALISGALALTTNSAQATTPADSTASGASILNVASTLGTTLGTTLESATALLDGLLQPSCATATAGHVSCLSEFKPLAPEDGSGGGDGTGSGGAVASPSSPPSAPPTTSTGPFYAADLKSLYNLPSFTGSPTIAIVDVGHDPSDLSDLAYYRSQTGVPALKPGQFVEYNQNGATAPLPAEDTGWDMEIALDLDVVSAVCATCNIMLVDANSSAFRDILTAASTAVAKGAQYVSLSLGSTEFSGQTALDTYLNAPDVTFVAASGDNGYADSAGPQVMWPATSPTVVAAGGISATKTTSLMGGTTWSLSAWSGAGAGCSAYERATAAQTTYAAAAASACGSLRATTDLSALADPNTGVGVFYHQRWMSGGGTSAAAPALAAMYAMAGNHTDESAPYRAVASTPSLVRDVTTGASVGCPNGSQRACAAQSGWDGPSGLGIPAGLTALATSTPSHGPAVVSLTGPSNLHVGVLEPVSIQIGFAGPAPYDASIGLTLPSGLSSADAGNGTQTLYGFFADPGIYTIGATPRLASPNADFVAGPPQTFTITVGASGPGGQRGKHRFIRSGTPKIKGASRGSIRKGRRAWVALPNLRGDTARTGPVRPSVSVVWRLDGAPVARGRSVRIPSAWTGGRLSYTARVSASGYQDLVISSPTVKITR